MAHARFDFSLAIGVADSTREGDDAIVREYVAVERVERRVVMSGVRTPSLRLSRTITRTVPPSRRNARSWSSAQICALDRHTSSRTDLREQPSVRTKRRVRRYLPVP